MGFIKSLVSSLIVPDIFTGTLKRSPTGALYQNGRGRVATLFVITRNRVKFGTIPV